VFPAEQKRFSISRQAQALLNYKAMNQRLIGKFLFLFFTLITSSVSIAQDSDPIIELKETPTEQVLEVEVAIAEAKVEQGNIEIQTKRGTIYTFPYEHDENFAFSYNKLTEENKIRFQKNRLIFLTYAATVLDQGGLGIGAGSYVKRRMSQYGRRVKNGVISLFTKKVFEKIPTRSLTASERGQEIIQNLLNQFDQRLWLRAPVVVDQNEISVTVSLSLMAEAGYGKYGGGGLAGLGISFGMNRKTKAAVFDVFTEAEWFKYGALFSLAIIPKIGFKLSYVDPENETNASVGETIYPPAAPGYFSSCDTSMTMGFSTNFFGFPSSFADLMCYVNSQYTGTILRVTASPATKGIFRSKLGRLIPQEILKTEVEILSLVKLKFKKCRDLLTKKDAA
jgi:hypothetical protein